MNRSTHRALGERAMLLAWVLIALTSLFLVTSCVPAGDTTPTGTSTEAPSAEPATTAPETQAVAEETAQPAPQPPSPPPALTPAPPPPPAPAQPQPPILLYAATVVDVVDGDTITVRKRDGTVERVRLIGIDTPEISGRTAALGERAAGYTSRALLDETVHMQFDIEPRDRYERLLAHVWLRPPTAISDAEIRAALFNARIVLDGYATLMTIPPNVAYVESLTRFLNEAREANRGLWAAKAETPAPAGGYVGSSRSDVFHEPGCRWAQRISPGNLVEWRTRADALAAGRRPCATCDP